MVTKPHLWKLKIFFLNCRVAQAQRSQQHFVGSVILFLEPTYEKNNFTLKSPDLFVFRNTDLKAILVALNIYHKV